MDRRTIWKSLGAGSALAFVPIGHGFGQTRHAPTGYIRTNWSQDPFSYGSYSHIARGSSRDDIHELAKPIDNRIYFAGEATHPEYNSTVHAAHEAGLIAADAVRADGHKAIAIVGAGMAGLSAAQRLARAGLSVRVFEGRDRIGGRIWTNSALGPPMDCGASWIHGVNNNPLTALADALGMERISTDRGDFIARGSDGREIPGWRLPRWVAGRGQTQLSAGADPEQLNRWAYWRSDEGYDGEEVIFPNGYHEIFQALSGDYEIQLSHKIRSIGYNRHGVTLTGPEQEYKADCVIVTVPLGVLKSGDLVFERGLPPAKQDAINRLGFGLLDKLYLKFDDVFWDRDAAWIVTPESGHAPGEFAYFLNFYAFFGEPVLMLFHGATPTYSVAQLPDRTLIERAMETLNAAYPV